MGELKINSEYSAQPSIQKPNPFLRESIDYILENKIINNTVSKIKVGDYGCGKLRHLLILEEYFKNIVLIDTKQQLERKQKLFEINNTTAKEYIKKYHNNSTNISVFDTEKISAQKIKFDIIFNICVFDVVLKATRFEIIENVRKLLKMNGIFVLIIPRNDFSIIKRCCPENRYQDGYILNEIKLLRFIEISNTLMI